MLNAVASFLIMLLSIALGFFFQSFEPVICGVLIVISTQLSDGLHYARLIAQELKAQRLASKVQKPAAVPQQ